VVLDYLNTRSDLDINGVGMYGQSSGGTIAVLSAAADPRIKAIDIMDPWGDWPDWFAKSPQIPEHERPGYLKPTFLANVMGLDPVVWLPLLKDRPIRVQEKTFNAANPDAVRRRIEAALPANGGIAEYKNKDEYTEKVSANGRMLDWLQAQLQGSSEKMD